MHCGVISSVIVGLYLAWSAQESIMGNKIWLSSMYPRNFGWILDKIVCLSFCPYYSRTFRKRPPKMQRLGGHLWGVVAYQSRTARSKFLSQPRMEWYVYLLKVYFPLTITGSF